MTKKQLYTCDVCGEIIAGPDPSPFLEDAVSTVGANVPTVDGERTLHEIDVCENHEPVEFFDATFLALWFDGEYTEGELMDLRHRDVIAVALQNRDMRKRKVIAPDDLYGDQRRYMEEVRDALVQSWQQYIDHTPQRDRNL